MHFLLSAAVFIIILALLVLVHEFGHFITAKKAGMEVKEFGFGFPPRIFAVKKGETEYSLNWLPFGGFVKITGEDNTEPENPRSFVNKGFWARFATLIAGVAMNLILAWVLLSIGFMSGLPTAVAPGQQLPAHAYVRGASISVLEVAPGSPADTAGMQIGDKITSIDGRHFSNLDALVNFAESQKGETLDIKAVRGSEGLEFKVLARRNPPSGQGAIGVELGYVGLLFYHPWFYAFSQSFSATWQIIQETGAGLYNIVATHHGLQNIGGPVKIASLTGQVTSLGISYIINFTALLSVNLALLNIIPFPALDGGRILFLLIEKIRGKKNNQTVEQWFNMIGFAILILLIILVSVRDVGSLIKR